MSQWDLRSGSSCMGWKCWTLHPGNSLHFQLVLVFETLPLKFCKVLFYISDNISWICTSCLINNSKKFEWKTINKYIQLINVKRKSLHGLQIGECAIRSILEFETPCIICLKWVISKRTLC